MKTNLRGKDFISTQEWTKEELETVLHLAFDLKMKWGLDLPSRLLEDKTLFMLFFFSSTRTRNSFEAGMTRLGGHAIFLEPDKMQISHGDTPKEIGKILSSYGHGIAIRHCDWGEGNKYLRDVAITGNVIRNAFVGVGVSVMPGAGTALVNNNMISETPRGAVVGLDHARAITTDLSAEGAQRYAQVVVGGNAVRR